MKRICLKLKSGLGLEEKIYKKWDKFPILWYTFCKVKSVYILKANDWVRLFLCLNVWSRLLSSLIIIYLLLLILFIIYYSSLDEMRSYLFYCFIHYFLIYYLYKLIGGLYEKLCCFTSFS